MYRAIRTIIKFIIWMTPFRPVHIGDYIRKKYFFHYLRELPIQSFKHVLDAGCSWGNFTVIIGKKYPHVKVTGYDIRDYNKDIEIPPNVFLGKQDLLTLDETNLYDLCVCIDVMEHIPGNRKVTKNIFRALKPGGYLYVHIPRPEQFDKRIFPNQLFREFDQWAENEHIGERYSINEIQQVLRDQGYTIIKAHCTFNFCGRLAWEMDKITDKVLFLKILLMPLMKTLVYMDLWLPKSQKAAVLVIAQKPGIGAGVAQ